VAYIGNVPVHSPSPEAKSEVVDAATGAAVNVSQGLHSARSPAWSPSGARLAFEAVETLLSDIFVCAPDGKGRENVAATPDAWESAPAFVDEDRLAYLAGPDATEVFVLDLRTRVKVKVSDRARFHQRAVASPDGKLLAVVGAEKLAGPGDLFLYRTDGSGAVNLTSAPAVYSVPCLTPDGVKLVFCFDGREIGGVRRGVASVPVAGGAPTLLARDGYPLAPLSISPDGSLIAYTSSDCYHSTWVNLMRADGSENRRLTAAPSHIIGWPSFSPDGQSLAYQSVYAARYTVHLVDLKTGRDRMLTPEGGTGVNPVFSPR
jgi:Tol biopolymer transport system component